MTENGVPFSSVNNIVCPCGYHTYDRNTRFFMLVGSDCFLIQTNGISEEVLTMTLNEAKLMLSKEVRK